MSRFINKNKVIEAFILSPYVNDGEIWDTVSSHGWQVKLVVGYLPEGYPINIVIDVDSELEANLIIDKLELTIY